jgi:transcriptional regulator with XRE-family HTH domain
LSNLQSSGSERGRPTDPPVLVPRQPKTGLGWAMRKQREVAGWTASRIAKEFGCSVSHISRVELGASKPSRQLVQFYEETFESDGLLHSLFEVAEHAAEQDRRRFGGRRPRLVRCLPGDSTAFVDDTIPHGTLMTPSLLFVKTWRIRNVGSVSWRGRQLERQGPLTGPGLITSPTRHVPIPDTEPGEIAEIVTPLLAPGYDCASIAYFKMVDEDGFLCFPDEHQLGLDVLVRVARNTSGSQD